jgi:hypothetical protein
MDGKVRAKIRGIIKKTCAFALLNTLVLLFLPSHHLSTFLALNEYVELS